jgi:DNA polymerase III epsilon subunit-like protein
VSEARILGRLIGEVARRCPGGKVPDTYMVFDTETNGTDVYRCKILQVGLCFVKKGEIIDRMAFYVKRGTDVPIPPEAQRVHGITHAKLAAEGIEPAEVIPMVCENFAKWREQGHMFLGHNILAFDAPLIELESQQFGVPWKFRDNEIVDTGMLVKGAQLEMFFRDDAENLRSFYRRVSEVRAKGVYWSLDRHCIDTYGLATYGIDKSKMHDAGEDCVATHFLLSEIRRRSANADV